MTNIIRSVTALLVISSALIITLGLFVSVTRAQTSAPTLTLTTAAADGGTRITWTVSGASSCIASQGNPGWAGTKNASGGSQVVAPTTATTYAMQCWNTLGFTTGVKSVLVQPVTPALPANSPTGLVTVSPASPITYPTNVSYILTAQNAKSCYVTTSDGKVHVAWSENITSKTIAGVTTPGTLEITTICASDLNGGGTKGAPTKTTVTVVCPSGTSWNGSACASGSTAGPTGLVTVSPASPITYPTNVSYILTAQNAKSCYVTTSDGKVHVAWSENITSKTIAGVTTPGTLEITTICASDLNGGGTKGAPTKTTVTVVCPAGKTWNGTTCAQSSTSTDNTAILALINQLMAQIASLQAQLLALQQGTTPTTPPTGLLTQNLSLGSTGAQVTLLQTKLATLGYLDDENISGYFGPITEAAVKKYQCDKGIVCTGTLSTTGYGGVGPTTRAALNGTTGTVTPPICPVYTAPPPRTDGCIYVSQTVSPNTCPTYVLQCPGTTTPTCPTGTSWNGTTCITIPTTSNCPAGTVVKTINNAPHCAPATGTTCPTGTTLGYVSGVAVCNANPGTTPPTSCSAGMTLYGGSCVSVASAPACPIAGQIRSTNGTCFSSINCASWSGTTCMASGPTTACPTGYSLKGSGSTAYCALPTGTTGGGSTTGASCGPNQDDIYQDGKFVRACPQAPNGGIACQVNGGVAECAGEGYVWINGQRVKWSGNTSGSCFADSACEANYVCGNTTKKCEPKTEWSTDSNVTGMVGVQAKRVWAGSAWGPWQFVSCVSGYEVSPTDSSKCIVKTGPVIDSLTVTPTEIYSGNSVAVYWQTTGATSCKLRGTTVDVDGQTSLNLTKTTGSYALIPLECKNASGMTTTENVQVNFKAEPEEPRVTLSASSAMVDPGQSVTISWNTFDYEDDGTLTSNTDGCHFTEPASLTDWTAGTGFTSKRPTSGSVSYTINADTTFKMWCRGSVRTDRGYSNELVVKVTPPPSILFSVSEGGASLGSWQGKSVSSSLTATGKGLVSCTVTNDTVAQYNTVYPSGHSNPSGMAAPGFSVRDLNTWLVNYPGTPPTGYLKMTTEEYDLYKGTTFRVSCTGVGGTTVKTDSF